MRKIVDLIEDLRLGVPESRIETLYALLARGSRTARRLGEALAADPKLAQNVQAMVEAAPARALITYARGGPKTAALLKPLLAALPRRLLLAAVGEVAPGAGAADEPIWRAVLEFGHGGLAGDTAADLAGQPEAVRSIVQALVRADRLDEAQELLAGLLTPRGGGAAAPISGRDPAGGLLPAVGALVSGLAGRGLHHRALAVTATAARAGVDPAQLGRLAAPSLLVMGREGAAAAALAGAIREMAVAGPDVAVDMLESAWRQAAEGLAARAGARQGHFARQVRELEAGVARATELLAEPGPWGLEGAAAAVRELCAAMSDRLARLTRQLVVFQPPRPEPVPPRGLILAVALAHKAEYAGTGLELVCAPPAGERGGGGEDPLPLEPVMVKAWLSQVIEHLRDEGTSGGGDGPPFRSVELSAGIVGGAGGAEAVFRVTLLPPAGRDRKAAAGSRLTGLLAGAAGAGTVPDLLLRCGASAGLVGGEDGRASLEARFPALAAAPPAGDRQRGSAGATLPPWEGLAGDPDAFAAAFLGCLADLTEAEYQAWGEDLAVVCHDLKNSFAFVAGWLRDGGVYDEATVRERCLENLSDVRFWLTETKTLLARQGAGEQPYVDLGELLERVLRGLGAALAGRRQKLELDVAGDLPRVPAEPVWVASVLRNLAKNAVEAMDEGGKLTVTGQREPGGEAVTITFQDEGPGFPAAVLAGEPTPPAADLPRLPLGLSTVRRLLRGIGGRLELANDGGGVAKAYFPTSRVGAELAASSAVWRELGEESRRALTAAAALAEEGDLATVRHLWARALAMEFAARAGPVEPHRLRPWASTISEGGGARPDLTAATRRALAQTVAPELLPRATAAARRLLGLVYAGEIEPAGLDPAAIAALVLLFGGGLAGPGGQEAPPLARFGGQEQAGRLAGALLAAAAAIDGLAEPSPAAAARAKVMAGLELICLLD